MKVLYKHGHRGIYLAGRIGLRLLRQKLQPSKSDKKWVKTPTAHTRVKIEYHVYCNIMQDLIILLAQEHLHSETFHTVSW